MEPYVSAASRCNRGVELRGMKGPISRTSLTRLMFIPRIGYMPRNGYFQTHMSGIISVVPTAPYCILVHTVNVFLQLALDYIVRAAPRP